MRLKFLTGAALVAALGVVMVPSSALSVVNLNNEAADGSQEFDSRVGKIAPTKFQRAYVKRLKAKATWSQFGTPATLTRHGKFLARGIRGKTAVEPARWYLNRHKALFGLKSLAGLEFDSANRLSGSNGWTVNFKQVFDGLTSAGGGLVTVTVVGSRAKGWKVVFVSSGLTRDTSLNGTRQLSAAGAWVTAARGVGVIRSVANVLSRRNVRGWTQFRVAGLRGNQLAKLVAFPTTRSGVLPAYETVVVDLDKALASKSFVDARTGKILARSSLVHNVASGVRPLAIPTQSFSGTVPAGDGSCAPDHVFAVTATNVRALDGFAAATVPTNDLVIDLLKDGGLLSHGDTFASPEQFHYEPPGGVVPGNYVVRICDFDNPPAGPGGPGWAEPRTYTGTFGQDDTPPPAPYLARWKVFNNVPPLYTLNQDPWNLPNTDTRQVWCWVAAPGCDRLAGGALTSRGPWDQDHKTNTPTLTTRGNNAKSATSWTDPNLPSPPQFMPTSATRDYSYPWTNEWANQDCLPTPGPTTWDQDAAATNLFVAHNRMHDWSYHLGFTERNWNGQDYNFGLTERRQENDPVIGNVQAGAQVPGVRDNANMITLDDGFSSITNMYFWQPFAGSFYAPCVDGDYDMGVIGHEYGHMIENRMIAKGDAPRQGHHTGAMGESHGDLFGMEIVNEFGFTPIADENRYAVGVYDTGNKQRAIRNYGMNFPMSGAVPEPGKQLNVDALNFSDMGYDITGPTLTSSSQVHANGEIWSATNFRLRQLLVDKYNDNFPVNDQQLQTECAEGVTPAHRCPGNRRWIQLVFDAMLMMPINATMLQARDAALAADLARFGGANQKELWLGYARSGMGANATSTNNSLAESDTDPVPDFEPVGTEPATVHFTAEDRNGNPIAARFYVGHYEARVSPIGDTDPATTAAINLDDTATFAPATYEFVAHAPGYGHVRFRERLRSGQNKRIEIQFARNWASQSAGATATGDVWTGEPAPAGTPASNVNFLIDDTEKTNWTAAPAIGAGGTFSADGLKVTVDLAGSDDVTVRYVQVSTMLWNDTINPNIRSGQNRFTAVRQFELWACNADEGDNCSADAGYHRVYTSPSNAFPGDPPRPVAPHMILRKFDTPNFEATHVRFVVKTTQCTGTPAFQGDQDADPGVNSDCDSNASAGSATAVRSTRAFARAAELQVFDRDPKVTNRSGRH